MRPVPPDAEAMLRSCDRLKAVRPRVLRVLLPAETAETAASERAKLLKNLAAAEAAAEKEWEAADDNVNKELRKRGQREGVTLTILRDILES